MADNGTTMTKQTNKSTNTSNVETTRNARYFAPRVDIFETESELVMYADMPGCSSEDIDLRYEQGELVVQGRVPFSPRTGHLILGEFEEGDYYRVFQIHESIDNSRIEAECKNGVLTVHLPKVEAAKPKQVEIKAK